MEFWNFPVAAPRSGYSSTKFWNELEFGNVGFWGERKTGVPGKKPLGAEKRTNNILNPHIASSPRTDPAPHRWEASALTTAPSVLPVVKLPQISNNVTSDCQTVPTTNYNITSSPLVISMGPNSLDLNLVSTKKLPFLPFQGLKIYQTLLRLFEDLKIHPTIARKSLFILQMSSLKEKKQANTGIEFA